MGVLWVEGPAFGVEVTELVSERRSWNETAFPETWSSRCWVITLLEPPDPVMRWDICQRATSGLVSEPCAEVCVRGCCLVLVGDVSLSENACRPTSLVPRIRVGSGGSSLGSLMAGLM